MMLQPTIESIADYADIDIILHDKDTDWFIKTLNNASCYDFILYIGAGNGPAVVPPGKLHALTKHTKLLHICTDGGCPGWWDTLKAYKEAGIKTVNIDGSFETPKGLIDLVTLTPPNPKYYKPKPWSERKYQLGFMGGMGSEERRRIIGELGDLITLGPPRSEAWGTYQKYADFMCDCKCVLNFARTGINGEYFHVKNRVLETAMAQAFLFEQQGSPLNKWFLPTQDYIEWKDIDDIHLEYNYYSFKALSESLYEKVMAEHNSKIWFDKILNLL